MTFLEISFKILKKIGVIIERGFIAIILILLAVMLILDITSLIFIVIRSTTGYCTHFMAAIIEKEININSQALELWSGTW